MAVKDDGRFGYEFFYNKPGGVKQKLQVKNRKQGESAERDGRCAQLIPFSSIESVDVATEPRGIAHIADVRVVPDNGRLDGYEAKNVKKLAHPLRTNDRIQIRGKLSLELLQFPFVIALQSKRSIWNNKMSIRKRGRFAKQKYIYYL